MGFGWRAASGTKWGDDVYGRWLKSAAIFGESGMEIGSGSDGDLIHTVGTGCGETGEKGGGVCNGMVRWSKVRGRGKS